MYAYVSPGAYIREIDLSLYVPAISMTTFGVVGTATWGPINEATFIADQNQFVRQFGNPTSDHLAMFSAMQYLRRGTKLWYVRVADETASAAYAQVDAGGGESRAYIDSGNAEPFLITSTTDELKITTVTADPSRPSGSTGTITLTNGVGRTAEQIRDEVNQWDNGVDNTLADIGASCVVTDDGEVRLLRDYGGSTETIQVEVASTADDPAAMNYDNDVHAGGDAVAKTCTFRAKYKGTFGDNIRVVSSAGSVTNTFKLQVYVQNPTLGTFSLYETWDNLVTDQDDEDEYYATVINATVGGSQYLYIVDTVLYENPPAVGTFDLTGGDDGVDSITNAHYIGTNPTPTGMQIFRSSERLDVNLLAVPGVTADAVLLELIDICEVRGDCLGIVDPPYGLTSQQVADWHNGVAPYNTHPPWNSSYACLYWPWIQVYDPYANANIWTPPCGHAAAVMAYTDYVRHPWYAPAGLNRGILTTALAVETSPALGERDLLYAFPNNVNPIVNFTGQGIVVWGQKTLHRAPTSLDRINVRRLLNYAKKVIASTVRYLVFEPNDATTWRSFERLVEPWFRGIQTKRGLYDFRVQCDSTTNPPEQIDQSVMVGKVFLQPTKAAEIVIVDFVLLSTGASFEEVIY